MLQRDPDSSAHTSASDKGSHGVCRIGVKTVIHDKVLCVLNPAQLQRWYPEHLAELCYLKCTLEQWIVPHRHFGWRLVLKEERYSLHGPHRHFTERRMWLMDGSGMTGRRASSCPVKLERLSPIGVSNPTSCQSLLWLVNGRWGKLPFTVISSPPATRGKFNVYPVVWFLSFYTLFQCFHMIHPPEVEWTPSVSCLYIILNPTSWQPLMW